jgi:PST family polysaccharide transporter
MVFFTKASSLGHQKTELRAYFFKWIAITVLGSIVVLSLLYLVRTQILILLNAEAFSAADILMPQQLLGDFFKSISYIIAMLAIAKGLMKRVIITEIASVVIYVSLVLWQTQTQPFANVSLVHSIRYFAYFLILALQIPFILKGQEKS